MVGAAVADGLRVRFSPEIFRVQRYGGVSRYVVEVHRGLLARDVDSRIVAGLHRNALVEGVPGVWGLDVDSLRPARARQAVTKLVDRAVGEAAAWMVPDSTVWHMSYFGHDRPRRAPLAVTVYDMIHERYPGESGTDDETPNLKRRACREAAMVFAISQATATDLQERLAVPPERIVVTHLGVAKGQARPQVSPFGGAPLVLYVGARRPLYKNWPMLLDALGGLDGDVGLLCFGPPEDQVDRDAVTARGLKGRVVFASGDDADLAGWYEAATALAYPSRYEGFGLPPLEALAHGCPVVATAVGAVPEVVGGVAELVEPEVEALRAGLVKVLSDGSAQRADGPAHAARFSWQATADVTLAGYRQILG